MLHWVLAIRARYKSYDFQYLIASIVNNALSRYRIASSEKSFDDIHLTNKRNCRAFDNCNYFDPKSDQIAE